MEAEFAREEVVMHLSWRDGVATVFVGVGAVIYALWVADAVAISPRSVAAVVLSLGVAASVTAVVYGVGAGLLRASKLYLAAASLAGLAAAIAGVWALATESTVMLGILVTSTIVLWLMATVRHLALTPKQDGAPIAA
jgi:hypothetical protein